MILRYMVMMSRHLLRLLGVRRGGRKLMNKIVRFAFTKKADGQGKKAKVHLIDDNDCALCNKNLDIDSRHIFVGDIDVDILPEDLCQRCKKIRVGEDVNI